MFIVRILLLSVLLLTICYKSNQYDAIPLANSLNVSNNDLILNDYGNANQLKINPPGYISFENSFYKYHQSPQTWAKARQICDAEGGYLAIINSVDEVSFLLGMINKYHDDYQNYISGFHDMFKEGEFVTIDGKSIESSGYNKWAPYQPDNYLGQEHCGAFIRNGDLNDIPCADKYPFICEIRLCTTTDVRINNQSNPTLKKLNP